MKAGVFFNKFSIIFLTTKYFSVTNNDSKAQKTEFVAVCLPISSINTVTSDEISMFDMSNESWSLLQ